MRRWLEARDDDALFRASLGRAPSFGDIVKLVHPKPATDSREASTRSSSATRKTEALPALVQEYEAFKHGRDPALPDVPFEMLTALRTCRPANWREIARARAVAGDCV